MNFSDIPFDITTTFNGDLRDVANDPVGMAKAVDWLRARLVDAHDVRIRGRILSRIGTYLRTIGRLDEASGYLGEALLCFEQTGDEVSRHITQIRLAHVFQWQQRFEEAHAIFEQLERAVNTNAGLAHLEDFTLQHYGKCLFDEGRYRDAEAYFVRALALREVKGDLGLVESSKAALEEARRRDAMLVRS